MPSSMRRRNLWYFTLGVCERGGVRRDGGWRTILYNVGCEAYIRAGGAVSGAFRGTVEAHCPSQGNQRRSRRKLSSGLGMEEVALAQAHTGRTQTDLCPRHKSHAFNLHQFPFANWGEEMLSVMGVPLAGEGWVSVLFFLN